MFPHPYKLQSKLHCLTSKSMAPPPYSLGLITRGDVWPWIEATQRSFNASVKPSAPPFFLALRFNLAI